jgi:hypothetical protein
MSRNSDLFLIFACATRYHFVGVNSVRMQDSLDDDINFFCEVVRHRAAARCRERVHRTG